MKIFYFSDIHTEFTCGFGPDLFTKAHVKDNDVVILAGDIGNLIDTDWINNTFERYKNVLYIMGNHEYYHASYPDNRALIQNSLSKNIRVCENETVVIDEVRIHLATMWTNFREDSSVALTAKARINDFRVIHGMSLGVMKEAFDTTYKFLDENVKEGDVVVTHFAPALGSVHPKYDNDPVNRYFVNDLEKEILRWKPQAWIHGHTHSSFDYKVGDTRVLANPHGYRLENPEFDPNACYEVKK